MLTVQQVATRLNVSCATVYRLVEKGMLTPIRVGARLRFDPDVLDQQLLRSVMGEDED